jgi:hypothetical protein
VTAVEAPSSALDESSPLPDETSRRASSRRAFLLGLLPIALLVLIPTAIFAGATLLTGHPLLIGDDLIQSYPLRVLVGQDLRHGTAPLWDPWIWSGTPLMAGLNAGAFYPTTFLFAVLPATGAWVITQIIAVSSVSVGTYVFLQESGTRRLPSFLGALSFAFAGAVAAQGSVHMDMAEGLASLPWMLLAVRRILENGRWRWSLVLGVAVACLILAGAPEAILDVSILCLAYGILRLSLQPSGWWRLVSRAAAGLGMGVGLSAFVWLPALRFIASSQRGTVTRTFAASYSFPGRALVLGIVPFLEGGWTMVAEPHYLGLSNLPEVAFYVGLLPVIAVIALLGRRWAEWLPHGERRTWYVVGALGLVLAVGSKSPLEHVIFHIPFYGKQRDQGRNIVDVDFAACMLFAWWLDGGSRPKAVRAPSEIVALTTVFAAVAAVFAWLELAPGSLWKALEAVAPSRTQLGGMETATAISLGLAAVAGAIVLVRHRMRPGRWLRMAAVFVVVDVALFASGTSLAATQAIPTAGDLGPLLQLVKHNLSPAGRYAVYNPDLFDSSSMVQAGEANVGILAGLPSIQGYGAVEDGSYSGRTATHVRGYLATGEVGPGFFQPLGLQVMLAPAEEFLTPIAALPRSGTAANLTPVVEGAGVDPLLPGGTYLPPEEDLIKIPLSGPNPAISPGERAGWLFGALAVPAAAVLVLSHPAAGQLVRVGEIGASGALAWQPTQRLGNGATVASIRLPPVASAGLVVQLLSGLPLGPMGLVIRADGRVYVVNGPLVSAMPPAQWTFVGSADNFSAFRAAYTPAQAWVQPLGTYAIAAHLPADVKIVSQSTDSVTISVRSPRPSILLRSTAFDPSWQADIVSGAGAARDLLMASTSAGGPLDGQARTPLLDIGVVQAVDIPSGLSVVRFSYEPAGYSKGLVIAAGTLAATLVACVIALEAGRRKRRARTPDPFGAL